jgi:hypothetical protein
MFVHYSVTLSYTDGVCHRDRDVPRKLQWHKCLQTLNVESDCGHGPAPDYEMHAISYASYASLTSSEIRKFVMGFFAFPCSNATHCTPGASPVIIRKKMGGQVDHVDQMSLLSSLANPPPLQVAPGE